MVSPVLFDRDQNLMSADFPVVASSAGPIAGAQVPRTAPWAPEPQEESARERVKRPGRRERMVEGRLGGTDSSSGGGSDAKV